MNELKYLLPPVAIPFAKDEKEKYGNNISMDISTIIQLLISLTFSVYAVYLSWTCNTALGKDVFLKVIFALFAGLFGFWYLIFYYMFSSAGCNQAVRLSSRNSMYMNPGVFVNPSPSAPPTYTP